MIILFTAIIAYVIDGLGTRLKRGGGGGGGGAVRFTPDAKSGVGEGGAVCFRSDTKSGEGGGGGGLLAVR